MWARVVRWQRLYRAALALLPLAVFLGVAPPVRSGSLFRARWDFPLYYGFQFVTALELNGDGIPDLAVPQSTGVYLLWGLGDGTFYKGRSISTYNGLPVQQVAFADLDGDGLLDAVATQSGSTLSVFLGWTVGGFSISGTYEAGDGCAALVIADLNGDARPDVAVVNGYRGSVSVHLGVGDGTLQPAVHYGVGYIPSDLVAGDLNGDGLPDLAVANYGEGAAYILLGAGGGAFHYATSYPVGQNARTIAAGDLDGDGVLDLALACAGSDRVSVLLGNGDGTFATEVPYPTELHPVAVEIADMNRDQVPDLIVGSYATGSLPDVGQDVSILPGQGDGTFGAAVSYTTATSPVSMAVADLNLDGSPDLAASCGTSKVVSVFLGKGDGTLEAGDLYEAGQVHAGVAMGDVNGDGILDLAAAARESDHVSVLLGSGDGAFLTAARYDVGRRPYAVTIADLDGNGAGDVVVTNYLDKDISVLLAHGDGTLEAPTDYAVSDNPVAVAAGDLDNDGAPDVVVALLDNDGQSLAVFMGNGDGTFPAADPLTMPNLGVSRHVVIEDMNGDGFLDLVATDDDTIAVFKGVGDGAFWPPDSYEISGDAEPIGLATGHLNGDGFMDVAVACSGPNYGRVRLFRGQPFGTLVENYTSYSTDVLTALSAGDLDGDGIPDLAVLNATDHAVTVFSGRGDGTFRDPLQFGAGSMPVDEVQGLALGDLNGDGRPDMATAGNDNIAVLLNTGSCFDVDGDGYGTAGMGFCPHLAEDCDDTDPAVNPGAPEICDNYIDDDCDGLKDGNDTDCGAPWTAAPPAEASALVPGPGGSSLPVNLALAVLFALGPIALLRRRRE